MRTSGERRSGSTPSASRELGIAPVVNNGIAHRDAGVGQVGAGINRLPLEPFEQASEALAVAAVGEGRG